MGSNREVNRGTGSGLMEQEMGSNWEENRGTGSGLMEKEIGSNWEENRGTGSGLMEKEMGSNWEENRGTGSGLMEQCSVEPKVVLAVKVHQSGVNDVAITPSKHFLAHQWGSCSHLLYQVLLVAAAIALQRSGMTTA